MAEVPQREQDIPSVLQEELLFPPPSAFASRARIPGMDEYRRLAQQAQDDPAALWAEQAEILDWYAKWDEVLRSLQLGVYIQDPTRGQSLH